MTFYQVDTRTPTTAESVRMSDHATAVRCFQDMTAQGVACRVTAVEEVRTAESESAKFARDDGPALMVRDVVTNREWDALHPGTARRQ